MRIEVIVLSMKQRSEMRQMLRTIARETKLMMRDAKDRRIDVSDLETYVTILINAARKMNIMLDDSPQLVEATAYEDEEIRPDDIDIS